jgi:hypothetical protein
MERWPSEIVHGRPGCSMHEIVEWGAYEIYEREGKVDGHAEEHYFRSLRNEIATLAYLTWENSGCPEHYDIAIWLHAKHLIETALLSDRRWNKAKRPSEMFTYWIWDANVQMAHWKTRNRFLLVYWTEAESMVRRGQS